MSEKIEKKVKAKIKYDNKEGLAIVTGDGITVKIKLSTTQLSQMYFSGALISTDVYLKVDGKEEPIIVEEKPIEAPTPIAIPKIEIEEKEPPKTLEEVIKEAEVMIEGSASPSPKKDEGDDEPPVDWNWSKDEQKEDEEYYGNEDDEKSDIEKSFDREVKRQSKPGRQNKSWKEWRGAYTGGPRGPFDSNN